MQQVLNESFSATYTCAHIYFIYNLAHALLNFIYLNYLQIITCSLPWWLRRQRFFLQRGRPGFGKIPWRRAWQSTPVFLPRESCGQRSLAGYSPWGCKELDMTEATKHACIHKEKQMFLYVNYFLYLITMFLYINYFKHFKNGLQNHNSKQIFNISIRQMHNHLHN